MKIVIVDDNMNIREVIKNVLDFKGVEFCECEDGGEAISRYSQFLPDWVLMDLSMAYVDGITALSELKAMFPESRILIVTDHDEDSLRSVAEASGADGYIAKENLVDLRTIIA